MKSLARTIIAFALLWFAPHALALTIASTTFVESSSSSTNTCNITVSTGQAVAVILNSRDNTGANYASSTWNGSNQPADETVNGTLGDGLQFHYLVFRGITGTANLVVTLSAAQDNMAGWCLVLTDPHGTTILGARDYDNKTLSGLDDVFSGTVGATTNDIAVLNYRVRTDVMATMAEGPGQADLDGPRLMANGTTAGLMTEPGAASVTMSATWTAAFTAWAAEVVVLQGAAGGGGTGLLRRRRGD